MGKKQTKAQWKRRIAEVVHGELSEPELWHYVSFADALFRGVVIIKAHGIADAVMKCHLLDINPGGEVMCIAIPDEIVAQIPKESRNRLLTREEVCAIWPDAKTLREHEEDDRASAS
jgi:hypothetical protein